MARPRFKRGQSPSFQVLVEDGREAYNRDRLRRHYQEIQPLISEIKLESGCVDCGYRLRTEALDFDHLPGTNKKFLISRAGFSSWERIQTEMSKCEIVCANCHRIRTADRRPPKLNDTKVQRHRTRVAAWLSEIKMRGGCVDCGFNNHPKALDFDHLPGVVKLFDLAKAASRSRESVLEEIAKCEVICANCHRIRTSDRRQDAENSRGN